MKTLKSEIEEYFASTAVNKIRLLKNLPNGYPAYVCRQDEDYGVAITFEKDLVISEHFANCRLYTKTLEINGEKINFLILSCDQEELREEFSLICYNFVNVVDDDGKTRQLLLDDPLQWWKDWSKLMGNTFSQKKSYDVIAELISLEYLFARNEKPKWSADNYGTHDIECEKRSVEVKSTIARYSSTITVSSQYQLSSVKQLNLFFVRLEPSSEGLSINDLKDKLVKDGMDGMLIERKLLKLGFEIGASSRQKKFKILDKRSYIVDSSFPKIDDSSFKDGKLPKAIESIVYTVDLSGLSYEKW